MNNLSSIILGTAIITTAFNSLANQSTNNTNTPQEAKIIDDTIKSFADIPEKLRMELEESLKKDYIVFHEKVIGFLPDAKLKEHKYHIEENGNRADVFIGAIYDNHNFALLSKIETHNPEDKNKKHEAIKEILKEGIIPLMYSNNISKTEINDINLGEIKSLNYKNTYQTEVTLNNKIIKTYYIFDSQDTKEFQRIFSISKEMPIVINTEN